MRRKCERGRGNINADGAGAEVFAGDGCSQGASFIPMAAISQRGQGGRIIIIRVRASRCGESALNSPPSQPIPRRRSAPTPSIFSPPSEHFHSPSQRRRTPADLTTHFPSKTFALPEHFLTPFPHTSTPHAAQTHTRRPHNTFPTEDLLPPPHSDAPCPSTFSLPPRPDAHPQAARCIPRRPHNTFPAEDLHPPQHNDTPSPSTFSLPPLPGARPQAARCTPADPTTHSSPKAVTRPRTATRSSRTLSHPLPAPTHTRRLRRRTPTDLTTHSPPKTFARPRSATLPPPLPFRFGHKKTAPHSACAMPIVSVDRRCGRSFGLVSRALFAAVAGRWRVGVGLRPQPWALRSRRCGRVLRA